MKQEHPQPDSKNILIHFRKTIIYFALAIGAIILLLSILGNGSLAEIDPKQQNLQLLEFRLKTGERLNQHELNSYCQLLCELRGVCNTGKCNDAVLLYRESVLKSLKNNLKGKHVNLPEIGSVLITGEGLRHTLKGKNLKNPEEYERNIKFIDTCLSLPHILSKLKYVRAEPCKNNKSLQIHIFKGKLSGGYKVRVIVKENHNGDYTFYDYSLTKI